MHLQVMDRLRSRLAQSLTLKTMAWLGFPVVGISGLAIAFVYFHALQEAEFHLRQDLQRHLNAQLTFAALTIQSFIGDGASDKSIDKIQRKIDRLPDIARDYYQRTHTKMYGNSYELIQFQIWDKDSRLLLKSHSAPVIPLAKNISGFSTNWVNGQLWHVFTNVDVETGMRIDVAMVEDVPLGVDTPHDLERAREMLG